jgi:DNA-binding transcriptional ArsR family regulator
METSPPDPLSRTLAALADPTRRAILAQLSGGEKSVGELAAPHAMSQPAISNHLKVLERAGLIERTRRAQYRPCRLQAAPLRDVRVWVDQYRRFWEDRFDRLEEYLAQVQTDRSAATSRKESTRRNG